jgi:acetyl-CoA carboxylase beta subunit
MNQTDARSRKQGAVFNWQNHSRKLNQADARDAKIIEAAINAKSQKDVLKAIRAAVSDAKPREIHEAKQLWGRCPECSNELLLYKRGLEVKHCPACYRSFDAKTNKQVANLGWAETAPGVFQRRV